MSLSVTKIIANYFEQISHVIAVYLFGSFLDKGFECAEDIDIAVLFDYKNEPVFLKQLSFQEDLSELLHKDVDLVVLNSASTILKMQVIRKGQLLITRNQGVQSRFVVQTLGEYFDLQPLRHTVERKIVQTYVLPHD